MSSGRLASARAVLSSPPTECGRTHLGRKSCASTRVPRNGSETDRGSQLPDKVNSPYQSHLLRGVVVAWRVLAVLIMSLLLTASVGAEPDAGTSENGINASPLEVGSGMPTRTDPGPSPFVPDAPVFVPHALVVDAGPNQTAVEGELLSFTVLTNGTAVDFLNWTKESGVRVEPGGPYDSSWAFHPNVVPIVGGFRMYYTGNSGPWRILSAVSSDQLTWTKEGGIRVDVGGGACDSVQAYSSEIFDLPNGTFRMYYTGYNGGFCILSAWSADGLTWTKEPGVRVAAGGPYDTDGPLSPHVVELVNGSLRMYYTGSDGSTFRILSAISIDGLSWSKEAGIRVDRGGAYDAAFVDSAETVLLPDGRVRMYYHGNDGSRSRILSAITSNGLIWTKDPGIRIDAGGPYDGAGVGYPDVVPDLFGGYRMFYGGSDGAALRILSAVNQAPTYAEWDFDVDVDTDGDLIPDNDVEATDLLASHTYWDDGVYSAKVCVTSANETACDVTNTSVTNLSPTASVDVAAASEGTIMNVNVTAMDPGSDDLTIEWFWQFLSGGNAVHYNDGSGPDPPHSSDGIAPFVIGTRVSENYTDDGSYMLYLNVTDDDGGVSSFVLGVSVSNSVPISVSLVGVPDIPVGRTKRWFSAATDQGSDDLTFEWQWGDLTSNLTTYYNGGGPDPRPSPGGTAPFQVIDVQGHSWTSVGTYSIVLRVSDDDGAVVQASLSVQVHPLPTTVMILGTPRYGGALAYITSLTDVGFSATDYSGFGVVRTEYRIDGGSWSTYTVWTPVQPAPGGR